MYMRAHTAALLYDHLIPAAFPQEADLARCFHVVAPPVGPIDFLPLIATSFSQCYYHFMSSVVPSLAKILFRVLCPPSQFLPVPPQSWQGTSDAFP